MQAGFALVETGFCRAKHAAHVVSTNFAIFGLGFVAFFLVGFPLMFSGFSYSRLRLTTPLSTEFADPLRQQRELGVPLGQERLGALRCRVQRAGRRVLPLHGRVHGHDRDDPDRRHGRAVEVEGVRRLGPVLRRPLLPDLRWVDLGRRLAGQARQQLGPRVRLRRLRRLGRGPRHGWYRRPRRGARARCSASASTDPTASRGPWPVTASRWRCSVCFILLFGWFGFNAASTFAATDLRFTVVAVNTAIAAAFGATIAMFYCMKRMGKPDPGMMVNGMLAGLVAITAPCAFVQPWAAAVIGALAAVIVVESVFFFERRGIDDPVGAISVHGVCGIFGRAVHRHLLRRALRRRAGTATDHGAARASPGSCTTPASGFKQLGAAGHRFAGHHLRDGRHRLRRSSSSRTRS